MFFLIFLQKIKNTPLSKLTMQRISSNATLFFALFLPTIWTVFFGACTLAVWLVHFSVGGTSVLVMRLGVTFFFLGGVFLLRKTLMRLRRVDLDEEFVFASNYFKTARYPYPQIEKITERDLGIFHLVRIYLQAPGIFGKRITFLLDEAMFKNFLEKHPDAAFRIEGKENSGER